MDIHQVSTSNPPQCHFTNTQHPPYLMQELDPSTTMMMTASTAMGTVRDARTPNNCDQQCTSRPSQATAHGVDHGWNDDNSTHDEGHGRLVETVP